MYHHVRDQWNSESFSQFWKDVPISPHSGASPRTSISHQLILNHKSQQSREVYVLLFILLYQSNSKWARSWEWGAEARNKMEHGGSERDHTILPSIPGRKRSGLSWSSRRRLKINVRAKIWFRLVPSLN